MEGQQTLSELIGIFRTQVIMTASQEAMAEEAKNYRQENKSVMVKHYEDCSNRSKRDEKVILDVIISRYEK